MRKTTIITAIVLACLGLGTWLFLANPFNQNLGLVQDVSLTFMEDIQFKDFRSSSLYHHKLERDRVDIGKTIEKLFLMKPEGLDIQEYRIVKAEVDSSGDRARVLIETKFRRLNMKDKAETGEVLLYWMKRHPDCPIGSTCPDGRCVDEYGEVIDRDDYEGKSRTKKKADSKESEEDEASEPSEFRCDPMAEDAWFMNLDSTLKEKRYNY